MSNHEPARFFLDPNLMSMNVPAKWYSAVVRDCRLSEKTFQLSQGNIVVGADSTSLWDILDAVPPESFENYNPGRGNLFSTNYGAIINSLQVDVDPVVTQAVQTWEAAGGSVSLKAFDKTIADLTADLTKAPGAKVVMKLDGESPDLRNAWTQTDTGRPVQLFRSLSGDPTGPPPRAGTVEVRFTHLVTFVAGPLAKLNPLNVGLKDYKPWYNSAALKLALDDPDAWNNPERWGNYFNSQKGSMLRCCVSLVVVDGVTTVTKPASSTASMLGNSDTGAITAGFWPFSIPPRGVAKQLAMRPLDDGSVAMESKEGNPLILGVNVQALSEYLGAAATESRPGSVLVRNEGWFYARFSVGYQQNGKRVFNQSGKFDRGTSFSIPIPSDASDILLKIEEMSGYDIEEIPWKEKWSTVFTANFREPTDKSYEVYGTTLDAKWRELPQQMAR